MKHHRLLSILVIALLSVPFLTGCGPKNVKVSEKSYSLDMASNSFKAGQITFSITNDATDQAHEFVIFKTDLPEDQLPLNSDGDVDENGQGVSHIDEVEDIQPGETKELSVNLEPGNYVAICNMPGHYTQGMHFAFSVK